MMEIINTILLGSILVVLLIALWNSGKIIPPIKIDKVEKLEVPKMEVDEIKSSRIEALEIRSARLAAEIEELTRIDNP